MPKIFSACEDLARHCRTLRLLRVVGTLGLASLVGLNLPVALAQVAQSAQTEHGGKVDESNTIRWIVANQPPFFSFPQGQPPQRVEDIGEGELAGFQRVLAQHMPQYHHEFLEVSLPRLEAMSRSGQTVCTIFLVPTLERHEWLYFTPLHPSMSSRQLHVVVPADRLATFQTGDGQMLQLANLLERHDLVGLVSKGRAYGPRIDRLLAAQGDNGPKQVVLGHGNLLAMLRAHRMDYTLEYSAIVDNYLRETGTHDLVSLPIAEGNSTTVGPAACSRTPEGLRQIQAIDQTMRQLAQDPHRETWIKAWLGKQPLDAADHAHLLEYLDERARAGPRIE